jgi:hypothetical protein
MAAEKRLGSHDKQQMLLILVSTITIFKGFGR